MTGAYWTIEPDFVGTQAAVAFASLDAVFAAQGEYITSCPISDVTRVEIAGRRFYVKRYARRGKGIHRWLGRSRLLGEWRNLLLFRRLGLPIPPMVAYGEGNRWDGRGAMVTEEVSDTSDLSVLAKERAPELKNPGWLRQVIPQVAEAARKIHREGFAHNDFKWRNILVTAGEQPKICLIDCPAGSYWWGPFLRYRIIKDLACLDKVAKYQLSRTQRLRFYLLYSEKTALEACDKKIIRKVLNFFHGRE